MSTDKASSGREELNEAYDRLEHEVPDRVAKILRWLRDPKARTVRLTVGVVLIILSFFWFLPIIGIEFLPIGLLLVAHDIPFLRKPVARGFIWLERKWVALRRWWSGAQQSQDERPTK
jgi:hypothetical protein